MTAKCGLKSKFIWIISQIMFDRAEKMWFNHISFIFSNNLIRPIIWHSARGLGIYNYELKHWLAFKKVASLCGWCQKKKKAIKMHCEKCSNTSKHRCSVGVLSSWLWSARKVFQEDLILPRLESYFCPLSSSVIWGKLLKASEPVSWSLKRDLGRRSLKVFARLQCIC